MGDAMKKKHIIILLFLVFSTIGLQVHYLGERYGERVPIPDCPWCDAREAGKQDVLYLPLDSKLMRIMAPADMGFLSDILWMRICYYFGQHHLLDQQYPYLFHMIDLITDLSPRWDIPYYFGAALLPTEANALNEGLYIIDKALVYFPDTWEFWFFKGYYAWKFQEDYVAAAEVFQKASVLPQAPLYLTNLSASFATQAGQKELAVRFLKESLKVLKHADQQKAILDKMKEIQENE
jgi:tetratricopeptide (TPR) repeat protein